MNDADARAAFAALSQETRLAVLKQLVAAGGAGMTAGEIAGAVGASPSRASFHLSTLAETGLVTSERRSREIVYRVDFGAMGRLAAYLLEDCCRNDPAALACCAPDSAGREERKEGAK